MITTRFTERFGVACPVMNAPMSGAAGAELAAAVYAGGGLGTIGGSRPQGAAWLTAEIARARPLIHGPLAVGFIVTDSLFAESFAVALRERIPIILLSFGDAHRFVAPAHDAGATVIVQVRTVAEAAQAAEAGADLIAAQGNEGGGHTGMISTLALLPAVVDAVGAHVPVIAAGGIADGRGLAAALLLGADAAWVGTRFAVTRESMHPEFTKRRVVAAGTDDTVYTRSFDLARNSDFGAGVAGRAVRNEFTNRWHERDAEVVQQRDALATQLLDALHREDATVYSVWAGSASGVIHDIPAAAEVVQRLTHEAEAVLRSRTGALLA